MKFCRTCSLNKDESAFARRRDRPAGLQHQCKECKNKINREWKAANRQSCSRRQLIRYRWIVRVTPAWADPIKLALVAEKAKFYGLQQDHVIPLRSKLVCGLHVWENIQLLNAEENLRKGAYSWPDMPC